MTYDRKMMPIGEGNLNWDAIFAAAADTHVQYALVEQDDCNGEDPFDCLQRSYRYLKAQGFE
ncbi:MAG: sugar phosphate isomerase/epimerase, partial [Clostridia bacterium]|nr:sugar phosphate isomerase/epimerase [Clostridia bacterium]